MKTTLSLILSILFVTFVLVPNTFAQDYTQWDLPEGAKARLGKGSISEIAYSPDSTRLAVASSIGIWIYDAETGKELDLLTGHTSSVYSVSFSPDGNTLASGSEDDTVRLWDANTGRHIRTLTGHTSSVYSVSFSPDGNTLASGGGWEDNTIRLWDVSTGSPLRTLTGHTDYVLTVSFSPDGNTLASGGGWEDNTIILWDANTGRHLRTLTGHTAEVYGLAFSSDGSILSSSGGDSYTDGTIRLWDVRTGSLLRTLTGHTTAFNIVAFSPDGTTLASGGAYTTKPFYGVLVLWDINSGQRIASLNGHTDWVYTVAFSPDGTTLTSGGSDNTIRLWDVETGKHIRTLTGHMNWVSSVSFSPDGTTLTSGGWDETVRLWDVNTGSLLRALTGHTDSVDSVSFSPDGKTLASGGGGWGSDNTVRLWDANTGSHLHTLLGHTSQVSSVSFSPDSQVLASGSLDNTIRLWDAETGKHIRTLTGHTGSVYSISFSPDGSILASGSGDDTLRLWDADTGSLLRTEHHTNSVSGIAFSPDGQTLANGIVDFSETTLDYTVVLWDALSGQRIGTLSDAPTIYHSGGASYSHDSGIAFSPDGRILASGDPRDYYAVLLWDAHSRKYLTTLTGHTDSVTSIAFSSDGRTLASGSYDGTVLLWELGHSFTSNATVSLSPATVASPNIGEQITFSLNISEGASVSGYQTTLQFDTTALKYIESSNSDYLPAGAFAIPTTVDGNSVTLAATSLAGESSGSGTLATITFEVVAAKASTVNLSNVLLTDSAGVSSTPQVEGAEITEPQLLPEDVNDDGVVNIIDLTLVASNFGEQGENAADVNNDGVVNIIDLTLVAAAFGNAAAAPEIWSRPLDGTLTRAAVETWLREARQMNFSDPTFQRGILILEQILTTLTPKATILLPNYPNPFNPETWIPYQLAAPADVSIAIYAADGKLVRTLALGDQPIGIYESRSRAAYWDGKNNLGERVASGIYFYTLTAGEFTATRKMLIRK